MRNFRELEVWQEGRILVSKFIERQMHCRNPKKFGLASQINRCMVSILANIAEGCAKYSDKDFARFLQISLGSAYELESHIILCEDLNFLSSDRAEPTIKNIQRLQRRIASLIKYNTTNH